ncbi:Cys-Gln thioester bond-forming surface protein [Listeria welshimeri]|nr:Cys-Gln thioester bond-forming surface protein [Listeria welshimeri]
MNNKKLNKLLGVLMVAMTIISTLFASSSTVHASDLVLNEVTGYSYTGVSPHLGYAITHDPLYIMKVDGKVVFCVESGIFTTSGGGYVPETYIDSKKDLLSKIAYYGYRNTSQSGYDYAVTQVMIWGELGDKYISSSIPNYEQRKAEIMAQVNRHETLPSWHNQEVSVQVGKPLTLNDTNGVFSGMSLTSNSTNTSISTKGNELKITAKQDSTNGTLSYQKVANAKVGTSIVYKKPNHQTLVEFHLDSTKQANLKVNIIKLGNVRIQKLDEDTGKPLAGATLLLEYSGTSKEVVTNEQGYVELCGLPQGTQVTIREVTAPDGFVNKGEVQTVIVEPNKTLEVRFNNKAQQGQLNLTKTGKKVVSIESTDSEYGDLHSFLFDYQPIAGVTYDIKAVEDIVIGGTTHHKAGEIVTTVTTGDDGNLINMPYLYLGKYEAIEVSAPAGYIVDSTPIPFEFTYAGQEVSLVQKSLTTKNEFQKLKLTLFKEEETIAEWQDNLPVIGTIPANDKIFGLYTNEDMIITPDVTLPKDSLLEVVTVTDGEAPLEDLQFPEGHYYFKELDAGKHHTLLDRHYEFSFVATDNESIKEIKIYEEEEIPLLNKLHFNSFSLKKLNEEATLMEKEGYQFELVESQGALFTLEDEDGTVIQSISVNDESLATFNYIPVGTFYLKEEKPSSDDYLLSDSIYRIESTKDGIQIYNEDDELVAEQSFLDEPVYLFEAENYLIKGIGQLSKTDVTTGDPLPNTGIRLLDEDEKIIFEGRTNAEGLLTYDELPKGIYYFQEFDAPTGYQIDETPIQFEIKEHGQVVKCDMTNKQLPKGSLPKTGDSRSITLYVAGAVISLGAMDILYAKRRKEKLNGDN